MSKSDLWLAVDIGGTFTDTVLTDANGQLLATTKTPTTPDNPTLGALDGVHQVLADAQRNIRDIARFIHGTTLATNALIERRGAVVATITTDGFRDILEIAYERRYSQYDINIQKPDMIVPRARALTVPERMAVDGSILQELDETALTELVEQLDKCGAEAVAICLLHAYANPVHEQRLRDLLKVARPDLTVSLSSDVSPEAREFERLCSTVANAYVQPLMATYLEEFDRRFRAEGLTCPVLMMTAGGGMTTIETASRYPIRLVESGPAGGAILAARVAEQTDSSAVLSFDMGGTTAKLCLIDDYQPQMARKFEVSRAARFIKGSGMPVRIPVLEMIEIGAGGGSIANVDSLGRITVGPQSAGSDPGPVAFCKGGTQATVTDSDIVLGLIDPDTFAEGRLPVAPAIAEQSLLNDIGTPLDMDAGQAAEGVSAIVDESMASAARMHAVESGKDLGARTMIAFGGNGPLHATRVARRAGVNRILIPRDPGVGSAVGFLHAPISFEIVKSQYSKLDDLDPDRLNPFFDAMITEAEAVVRAGAPDEALSRQRSSFMRYHGQGHEIEIPLPDRKFSPNDIPALRAAFEAEYSRQFSRAVPGMTIEILNWALSISTLAASTVHSSAVPRHHTPDPVRYRTIRCDVTGEPCEAAVYDRVNLAAGAEFDGPALIIEPQTTTFVSRDFKAQIDGDGLIVLIRKPLEVSS